MNTILFYFLLFIIYSFLGWMVEVLFVLIMQNKLSNRGFLIGPYCPIYGTAALLMHIFLIEVKDNFILLFILTAIGVTVIEYLTSLFMEKVYKARWWDYSDKKFNFQGRICLSHTMLFGVLGIVFIYFINPKVVELINDVPIIMINIISLILLISFIFDLIASFNIMHKIQIKAEAMKTDYTDEINELVRDILKNHSAFTKRLISAFPNIKLKEIIKIKK